MSNENLFYERRPTFVAIRFDGSIESAREIISEFGASNCVVRVGSHFTPKLEFSTFIGNGDDIRVPCGDWIVRTSKDTLEVLTDWQMSQRFEKVAP